MFVTEFGIVGGVVSDVQPHKNIGPILTPEYIPKSNSRIYFLSISTILSFIIDE
jgi:hypothetical protein